jgi:hypothetical protein
MLFHPPQFLEPFSGHIKAGEMTDNRRTFHCLRRKGRLTILPLAQKI